MKLKPFQEILKMSKDTSGGFNRSSTIPTLENFTKVLASLLIKLLQRRDKQPLRVNLLI